MSRRKSVSVDAGSTVDEKKALAECIAAAETYVKNCKKFEVTVDPSVVIALRTGWNILKPSKTHGEGSLLPLMGILEENNFVTKINLEDISMQDGRFVCTLATVMCSRT